MSKKNGEKLLKRSALDDTVASLELSKTILETI